MNDVFNYRVFHRRRTILKWLGLGFVVAGLFTIVDMMSEVPIPLTGYRAVFAGTILIFFGLVSLYKGYKLPLEEALELIHNRQRGITESEIVHEMLVDQVTARRIIDALVRQGFLRHSRDNDNVTEDVYDSVR